MGKEMWLWEGCKVGVEASPTYRGQARWVVRMEVEGVRYEFTGPDGARELGEALLWASGQLEQREEEARRCIP